RLAGDPRLRHGASERAEELRHRSGRVPGFRLGSRHRSHRHAQVRDERPARVLRGGRALALPLRLPAAGFPDARGRAEFVMKFTLSWLREHLYTHHALAELTDELTMIGLEVENLEDKAAVLAPYVIARVVEAKQHPNADRLRVCMVDIGAGDPVQVVCGAPNARTGMKGVFVPPGA